MSHTGMRPRHGVLAVIVLLIIFGFRFFGAPRPGSGFTNGNPGGSPSDQPRERFRANATDVPVPASCTPAVNQRLADLLAQQQQGDVDNVMVCGTTISPSRTRSGGPHGSHHVLPLLVSLPGSGSAAAGTRLVEVVTNDDLDGVVTAPKDAAVIAYGQAFFPSHGQFIAGVHDVHCSTHRGADNGWVVVNGQKSPASCASAGR